jgi:hypothetical protein
MRPDRNSEHRHARRRGVRQEAREGHGGVKQRLLRDSLRALPNLSVLASGHTRYVAEIRWPGFQHLHAQQCVLQGLRLLARTPCIQRFRGSRLTLSLRSPSATTRRQSPLPMRLHVWMQLLNAARPATGSLHASSHAWRGGLPGARACCERLVRSGGAPLPLPKLLPATA